MKMVAFFDFLMVCQFYYIFGNIIQFCVNTDFLPCFANITLNLFPFTSFPPILSRTFKASL